MVAVSAKGFSMLKEAVSIQKGFVHVKLKVYVCYAWVRGRQKWCRKTWSFSVMWFWRVCFWALIMVCHLYRARDSCYMWVWNVGPRDVSPHTYPLPCCPTRGHHHSPFCEIQNLISMEQQIQILDILLLQRSWWWNIISFLRAIV